MYEMSDDLIESPWGNDDRQVQKYIRPVKISAVAGDMVDKRVVSYQLYNSFNYSAIYPSGRYSPKFSIGVTSPGRSEGKTTAVCNLAVALAMGTGRKTVLVDFNIIRPSIHQIFGMSPGPGLAEALSGSDICVVPTQLDNLFALPAGDRRLFTPSKLSSFREVLSSLNSSFEFVLVDLPPAGSRAFPTIIVNQLGGLLIVVRPKMTKRREVGKVFRKLHDKSVLGFIMNGVDEDDI